MLRMPKALCWTGIGISILVAVLFLADLILGMAGQVWMAPFKYTSMTMDLLYLTCACGLAVLSWMTLREQD